MAMESLLEALPPEIRRHLLSTLDLEELKILVHASPVFHEQYLLDRRFLLCRCLENTLGSVAIDACAVYRTGSVEFARTRTSASIGQFLVTYGKQRFRGKHHSPIAAERLGLDEAVNMALFHRSIILPLVRHLATWTLANLAVETGRGDRAYGHDPQLSRTEQVRLTRALYRFQLACNLFGRGVHGSSERPQLDLSTAGILDYFICLFEPWEVEEFSCVHMLAKQSYEAVFHAILWDVHEENPKFHGQRSSTPPGSFELDNSCWFLSHPPSQSLLYEIALLISRGNRGSRLSPKRHHLPRPPTPPHHSFWNHRPRKPSLNNAKPHVLAGGCLLRRGGSRRDGSVPAAL